MNEDRAILRTLYDVAVASADPSAALLRHLPEATDCPTIVVGAGKASHEMARSVAQRWQGPLGGLVVVPYGHQVDAGSIEIVEASHPVPDQNGYQAANRILSLVSDLKPDDLVVALISGGGSALLPCPPCGFTLADEILLNEKLLTCGAPISAMNAIRKQFSRIKGGRLAVAAHPARIMTFVVSDVPGDDPAQVASGPTVADRKNHYDAARLLERYGIDLAYEVHEHISHGIDPAPSPDDARLANCETSVIASASVSLEAVAEHARRKGLHPVILSDAVEGEAREVAKVMAAIAKDTARFGRFTKKPAIILSGGETSVTIQGGSKGGKGGRNSEFLLSFAIEIDGWSGITALAADTDGIDGSGGHAGAIADGETCSRIVASGGDAEELLGRNNSYSAFDLVDSLLKTGPTGTNVNDFRAIIVR